MILFISAYKRPSILAFAVISAFVVFLVRPSTVLVHGSTIITEDFYSNMNYEFGLKDGLRRAISWFRKEDLL